MTFLAQPSGGIGPGEIAAALAWWREAGVDYDFADAPHGWLKPERIELAEAVQAALPAAAPPLALERFGGAPELWPQSFEAFAPWWLAEPALDGGQTASRIAPRGPAQAELMVLVAHPEAEDRERLLSGPQGRLLDAILAALGIAPDTAYIAAALPRCMPLPDLTALAAAGLGELLAHHIALAAPQRLLVFGNNISSLLGHDPANSTGFLPNLHHEGRKVPMLVAPGLESLAARPRGKARLWQALLDWQAA